MLVEGGENDVQERIVPSNDRVSRSKTLVRHSASCNETILADSMAACGLSSLILRLAKYRVNR